MSLTTHEIQEKQTLYLGNSPVLNRPAHGNEPLHGDGQGHVDGGAEGHSRHGVEKVHKELRIDLLV